MIDTQRFEALLEDLSETIEDLEIGFRDKDHLTHLHTELYSIFEEAQCSETEEDNLSEENELLKRLLTVYLSHEDKQYLNIKYDLDL